MTSNRSWSVSERPVARRDIEVVEVGDERVIWDPVANRVHRLDAVAAVIWPFLDGTTTIGELAAETADAWGLAGDDALVGLVAFVARLDEASLLVTEPASSGPGGNAPS